MIRRALYHGFSIIGEKKVRQIVADSNNPRAAQERKLKAILQTNSQSAFGRDHGFAAMRDAADFQKSVPVRDYEDMRPYMDRAVNGEPAVVTSEPIEAFATTSGTTGKPKYLPITRSYVEEFRLASIVSGYALLRAFPNIANGTTLSVVSPAEEGRTAGGIPYGAISGHLFRQEPYLLKKYISPIPYEVFLIEDYETRYYTLLRIAIGLPVSLFYTLNPSTIALLCRRLQQYGSRLIEDVRRGAVTPPGSLGKPTYQAIAKFLKPDRQRAEFLSRLLREGQFVPQKIWPTLSVVSCWTKASAAFYLGDFPQYFGSVPVCDITYGASEGRGTVLIQPDKQMLAINSHFFEFIPEAELGSPKPTVLLAHELEVGQKYGILFTTSGGLYRYNINDIVKVTGYFNRTPLIEFQYKAGNVCSFTGEKITELQVVQSMSAAANQFGIRLRFFTLLPRFRPEPHYELLIEFDQSSTTFAGHEGLLRRLAETFDECLGNINIEYKAKRNSQRLLPVAATQLASGTYEQFRKHLVRQGVADAQIKVSHLNPKSEVADYFQAALIKGVSSVAGS